MAIKDNLKKLVKKITGQEKREREIWERTQKRREQIKTPKRTVPKSIFMNQKIKNTSTYRSPGIYV